MKNEMDGETRVEGGSGNPQNMLTKTLSNKTILPTKTLNSNSIVFYPSIINQSRPQPYFLFKR